MTNESQDLKFSIAQFFADIILSRHNQFCSVRIVAKAGMGKSWFAVDLALAVAEIVGKFHNEPANKYFDFDETHLSVMDAESLKTTMANPIEHSILLQDDVGTVLNARRFMSENNIDFNDTFQTWRPHHNLLIQTLQTGALLDKVPRILSGYEIEIVANMFDEGLSIAKVQEIKLDHKTGFIYYPYIVDHNGNKISRVVSKARPKEIMDRYEKIRSEMLTKLMEKRDNEESNEPVVRGMKITKEELLESDILEAHNKYIEIGEDIKFMPTRIAESVTKINRFKLKCNQQLVRKVLSKYNLLSPRLSNPLIS